MRFRLMTYNVGGARKDFGSDKHAIRTIIREVAPDILAVQEFSDVHELAERSQSQALITSEAFDFPVNIFFGPTLSMAEHFTVQKSLFVHGIYNDWIDWRQGNALFSRWPFVRLGEPTQAGIPRNIPLYRPCAYDGTRDTESRYVVLARIAHEGLQPFILNTHFTALLGERGDPTRLIPGKDEKARNIRERQSRILLKLVQKHLLETQQLVFLLGDFNAIAEEKCISDVLLCGPDKAGFTRLLPENDFLPTHRMKVSKPVDHILVYPGNTRIEYRCRIVNTPAAAMASDHLPVVADVIVYTAGTPRFDRLGAGVVRGCDE